MMENRILLLPILCISFFVHVQLYAQKTHDEAYELASQAVKSMEQGDYQKGQKLLEKALKLDPDNYIYSYELAIAMTYQKKYEKAIKLLKASSHPDVDDTYYQLLGNNYDLNGQSEEAIKIYDIGLEKFPHSGRLYLEKGNVYLNQKEYMDALDQYEMGIKADPNFPSNYYRATLIYAGSTEEVWAMIYGETFMNLERNSKRTEDISKLLFDLYRSEIVIESDTSMTISFSQFSQMTPEQIKNGEVPFGLGAYEPLMLLSVINCTELDLACLVQMRNRFIREYYKSGHHEKYKMPILSYQKKVLDAGHMEAYSYWILMKGDESAFSFWQMTHKDSWKKFTEWFLDNQFQI